MDRRDFIKLCAVSGLGLATVGLEGGEARAAVNKLFVFVNASGGWDHTLLCDPKGDTVNSEGYAINAGFTEAAIGVAGNIRYAPVGINQQFFDRFYQQLLVINGIDCETNGHDTGLRNTFAGKLIEGTPALPALISAALAGELPLSYISSGGYDTTDGLVAPTRLGDNLNALQALIYPNRIDPNNEESQTYYSEETFARIVELRQVRTTRYQELQNLPRIKKAMGLLYTSRLGMGELRKIDEFLPDDINQYQGVARQAVVALAAYKAGLCQCTNMAAGGFDTHSNNDQQTPQSLANLLNGIMVLYDRAEELDMADELVVVVGSDFGRTPRTNEGNGKDHWSVGSMMFMGEGIPGNTVIGATDDVLNYRKVDPATLQVDDGAKGKPIKNAHIHQWLRKLAGIDQSEVIKNYPLVTEEEFDFSAA